MSVAKVKSMSKREALSRQSSSHGIAMRALPVLDLGCIFCSGTSSSFRQQLHLGPYTGVPIFDLVNCISVYSSGLISPQNGNHRSAKRTDRKYDRSTCSGCCAYSSCSIFCWSSIWEIMENSQNGYSVSTY